jgi:hypothetical protein
VSDPARAEGTTRAARAALVLLASAVAVGAVLLGAPPRFSAGANGPAGLRDFLTALGPLTIVEAAAVLALGLLAASECLRRGAPGLPGGSAAARVRLPLVLLLLLGLLQLVPLPAPVLRVAAPFSARTYASLAAPGDDAMRPMSLWPDGTAHALFNLAGMIAASAAVWTLARAGRARRVAVCVLVFVAAVAAAESAHGLVATKLGDDMLLGTFGKASDNGRVTGTFIHATMLAVWAGMGACAAIGLAAAALADPARRRVVPVAAAVAAVCVAGGAFSLSRLGWIGVAAGVVTTWLLLALALRRGGRPRAAFAMAVAAPALAAGAAAVMLAVPAFRERVDLLFTRTGVSDPRFPMWESAWALFREAPVLGTGLGSFGRAIHLTQSPDCERELWFAHSDPLNLLSDTGVVGALLGAWWLAATLRRGLPALRSSDAATCCLSAAALGGAAVAVVSSLGDFQTQFPVVAIPLAALLTIPAALADAGRAAAPPAEPRPRAAPRALAAACLAAALAAAAVPCAATLSRLRDLRDGGVTGATRAEALTAQGRAILAGVPSSKDPKESLSRAEAKLREAARLDPLFDDAQVWSALAAMSLGEPRDDVLRTLGRARTVARGRAWTNLLAGRAYLDLIGTEPAPYGPPGDGAIAALREAGDISPQAFSAAWAVCAERRLGLEVLRGITPDRGYAKTYLFDHLVEEHRSEEAIALLEDQLAHEPSDDAVAVRLAAALAGAGREAEGRALFRKVGAKWPERN